MERFGGRNPIYTPGTIVLRSNLIASLIKKVGEAAHVPFLDMRERLRKMATTTLIHGPKDWNHLNKEGYTTLTEAILDFIDK